MKRVVYKMVLPGPGQSYRVMFRRGFIPIHVALQRGAAYMWFEVPLSETSLQDLQEVELFCVGTGHSFPNDSRFYLGTVIDGSGFVWHYYAKIL